MTGGNDDLSKPAIPNQFGNGGSMPADRGFFVEPPSHPLVRNTQHTTLAGRPPDAAGTAALQNATTRSPGHLDKRLVTKSRLFVYDNGHHTAVSERNLPTSKSRFIFLGTLVLWFTPLLRAGSPANLQAADQESPPYGVKGHVTEPRLFAEGIISTVDDEIGGAFSPDDSDSISPALSRTQLSLV